MKNLFLLFPFLFLLGCGDQKNTSSSTVPFGTEQFTIQGQTWEIILPEGWQKNTQVRNNETILQAYKNSENLLIVQKPGEASRVAGSILGTAEELYFFKEISQSPSLWEFQAKLSPSDPLRNFVQKVFSVPDSNFYLLASCSYETNFEKSNDCHSILDSFRVLVDKNKK